MSGRLATVVAALAGALLAPGLAAGVADFDPCSPGFECANIAVPLDRAGAVSGTVGVHIEKLPATRKKQKELTLLLLAGGPGQSATDAYPSLAYALASRLPKVELIVYDQRGTGLSDALRCTAFALPPTGTSRDELGDRAAACGGELGPARGFFRTLDTVADIEAVREALGVERIGLLGVSYGTHVAQAYARIHPDRVALLVLDSVVAGEGRSAFELSTLAAIPRVLRDLCRDRRCAGVTRDPVAELARLIASLETGTLRGTIASGRKLFVPASLGGEDAVPTLVELIVGTDLAPQLQAALPSVLTSAAAGDAQPLFRLLSGGSTQATPPRVFSDALLVATLCSETVFPWAPGAATADRPAQLEAAIAALDPARYAPFDQSVLRRSSLVSLCGDWPDAATTSEEASLPDVPALILSGQFDTRTPLEDALALEAALPQAKRLVVPNTGHSTISTDCGFAAVVRFLRGKVVRNPCRKQPPVAFDVPPVAPRSLDDVPGTSKARRTGGAVLGTFDDLVYAVGQGLIVGRRLLFPGLRSGWGEFRLAEAGIVFDLHKFAYVPGVTVTGTLIFDGRLRAPQLRIGGGSAARGTLRLTPKGLLVGKLGGQQLRLRRDPRVVSTAARGVFAGASARLAGEAPTGPSWHYAASPTG